MENGPITNALFISVFFFFQNFEGPLENLMDTLGKMIGLNNP